MASLGQIQTALSYFRAGLIDEAKAACEAIVAAEPNDPAALRLLGQIAHQEGDFPRAADCLKASLAGKADQYSTWIKLGNVYSDLGRVDDAKAAYDQAIALQPDHHLGHFWKGLALAAEGDMERAFQAYEAALKANPDFGPGYRLIVQTGNPWVKTKTFREELEVKAARPDLPADDRIHMHFALAHLYQDQGKPERMMGHLRFAKGLQKNRAQAWRPALDRLHAGMRDFLATERKPLPATSGKNALPVWIVGAPRSGTALLEAMLAMHPSIGAGGEAPVVPRMLKVIQNDHTGQAFPDGVAGLKDEAWSALSANLAEAYSALADGKPFVTDKLLSNGQVLGLIHFLAPGGKALYVRRNPSDTALSIFKNHFWEGAAPHLFSLDDIGHFIGEYEKLMAFWQALLPGAIHELTYEALVADAEGELKKVFSFLGLPYDPACLKFHEAKRPTAALNPGQARKPIYQTSVGQAAAFAQDLEPFLAAYRAASGKA